MKTVLVRSGFAILFLSLLLCIPDPANAQSASLSDPPNRDSILDWNAIALQTVANDFTGTYGVPDQPGPTHTSRAMAIIHLAMYDAANMIKPVAKPYLPIHLPTIQRDVSLDAAVAQAAYETLTALYPKQASLFKPSLERYLALIRNSQAKDKGKAIGSQVAKDILRLRQFDGSAANVKYVPTGKPGIHDVDPINPTQGFLDPGWGDVVPFCPMVRLQFNPNPPPPMNSPAYLASFNDVRAKGGDGITTPTTRTAEETQIAIFWSYDGTPRLGTPPRLYNQIARTIATQKRSTEIENARLFALINVGLADAGILCWQTKYIYDLWRPVLGIRRAAEDGNAATIADPNWTPLGAPASNSTKNNFTPNFPSYSSGHATFGAAFFRTLQRYYGTDNVPFTFISDELNGITTDNKGNVRPVRPRTFQKLSDAAKENARSRIYLGVHWQIDADEGMRCGTAIGDNLMNTLLKLN